MEYPNPDVQYHTGYSTEEREKSLNTSGCSSNDLKCLTKESCSSAVFADNDLHKCFDRVLKMYEESVHLMSESVEKLPDVEARSDIEVFKNLKPAFHRRMVLLERLKQELSSEVPCPVVESPSPADRAVAVKARALCNFRSTDQRYHISERASQVGTQVSSAVGSLFTRANTWMRQPKEGNTPE
eukprot:GHVL01036632.1.p1 GENE.GHVL01036632.1~~GHVL01036632.1.p1  ORF type:complete len:184 (-),score=28.21 GHVL01036632.1:106-657(-)